MDFWPQSGFCWVGSGFFGLFNDASDYSLPCYQLEPECHKVKFIAAV